MVAKHLGVHFMDLDTEIVKREGRTVGEIFAADGEEYFREFESTLTGDFVHEAPMVVATGGGWMMDQQNVEAVRPPGRLVYLRVSPEIAVRRMGDGVALRPLLSRQDPIGELTRLYQQRDSVYMAADLTVDTEPVDAEELTSLICDFARLMGVAQPR
jgi:shikimate kinase